MKLVISGVPGCGKTRFGDWLRDVYGFAHLNLELRSAQPGPIRPPPVTLALADWLGSVATKTVVTWGFPPTPPAIEFIRRCRAAGFTPWWFDGDHDVARRWCIDRDGLDRTQRVLDPHFQQLREAAAILQALYGQNTITTLTEAGHRAPEEIHAIMRAT